MNFKKSSLRGRQITIVKLAVSFAVLFGLKSCTESGTKTELASREESKFNLREAQVIPADYEYGDQTTFKVLSWNVEHFVDKLDDPYIKTDREDRPDAKLKEKLKYLVKALRSENADVVLLQEFESSKFLRQIAEDSLSDLGYKFFASAPSDTWYMNVVVMSKFPLGVMYSYGNVNTPVVDYVNEEGNRESQNRINTRMWSLDVFPAEDYNFILTGLHLKAGRGERNEAMRLGQINFLKYQFERFLQMNPDQNLLIAGDLNSVLGSKEMETLKAGENKATSFVDPLPEDVMTHPVENPSRRLDYVLCNGNMQSEYVQQSAQIPEVLNQEKLEVVSDHLPLVISFKTYDQ